MSQRTDHEAIGGAAGIERLVDRFYTWMDILPEAQAIRALHQDDLAFDRVKLRAFLSGWLGGPTLYWERHDPETVRQRHRHLHIDAAAREAWLRCMTLALEEVVEDVGLRDRLRRRFQGVAAHVRNQPS